MKNALEVMNERCSTRAFLPQMPEKEKLEKILEAGTNAPTGRNKQSPIIIAVTNKKLGDRLAGMKAEIMGKDSSFDPFYGAPVVLIVLADKSANTYIYDGSLVMGNLLNACEAVGLGGCWIHRAKEEFETDEGKEILKSLGIEGDYEGIGHCVVGYEKNERTEKSPRKDNYIYYID